MSFGRQVKWMIGRLWLVTALGASMAMGQAATAPKAAAPVKALAFEVVSIRQNVSEVSRPGPPEFGPTPDGYRMTGLPLILAIVTGFVPSSGVAFYANDHIIGVPDWAQHDRFDIQAKVADEDLPEWQKPAAQPAMLRAMLQAFLADRCKIAVHREYKEVAVYSMVVGKGGPKFKPTNPNETHEGLKLPFGGILATGDGPMTLFAAPMGSLATVLSWGPMGNVGRPIQDKTGLTGLYDIVFPKGEVGVMPQGPQDENAASDPSGNSISTMMKALGLKLESTKALVETLVIDHIERPSEN